MSLPRRLDELLEYGKAIEGVAKGLAMILANPSGRTHAGETGTFGLDGSSAFQSLRRIMEDA
jgi:hypothetical protein